MILRIHLGSLSVCLTNSNNIIITIQEDKMQSNNNRKVDRTKLIDNYGWEQMSQTVRKDPHTTLAWAVVRVVVNSLCSSNNSRRVLKISIKYTTAIPSWITQEHISNTSILWVTHLISSRKTSMQDHLITIVMVLVLAIVVWN